MLLISELVHYLEQIKSKYGNGYVLIPNGKPMEYDHLTPDTILIDKTMASDTKEVSEQYSVFLGKPTSKPIVAARKRRKLPKKRKSRAKKVYPGAPDFDNVI